MNEAQDDADFMAVAMNELCLSTDVELEKIANLAKNTLSKARNGTQSLGAFNRAKLADLCWNEYTRAALLNLFGVKGREWIALDARSVTQHSIKRQNS